MMIQIDPSNVTNFKRSRIEAEQFLVFCSLVAGKNADQQAEKQQMLLPRCNTSSYLDSLVSLTEMPSHGVVATGWHKWNLPCTTRGLFAHLQHVRMGQYYRITRAINDMQALRVSRLDQDIRNVHTEDLVKCFGVSYKTANYFLLHSREGHTGIPLDTHILSWARWFNSDIPHTTPTAKKYPYWETVIMSLMHTEFPKSMSLAEIDLAIWNMMRGGNGPGTS